MDIGQVKANGTIARIVDADALPVGFPTHRHGAAFWELLGRTVATYGFLEEMPGKAIFSFAATERYEPDEVDAAFEKWLPTLEKALTNPLGEPYPAIRKGCARSSLSNAEEIRAPGLSAAVDR